MLQTILTHCDHRHSNVVHESCADCSYGGFCPHNCEKCLDYIHNPSHAPVSAPPRKYDCTHMADFYVCKYSCRYTSEIVYAIERSEQLSDLSKLKVLSFGCGPCTDLFAIDHLHTSGFLKYTKLEYRGIDYSQSVWKYVHQDISTFQNDSCSIKFYYKDACDLINTIAKGNWVPNLIVFQYVFSDMRKHTDESKISTFIDTFARYYNEKAQPGTCIILNDINLSISYGGGREYFDRLFLKLSDSVCQKGRFCDDNATSPYYPRGYTYGENSCGEFPDNSNRFDISPWRKYSPFNTCASAQMLIRKEETT